MKWLEQNWSTLFELSLEHLILSVPAILLSIVLAIPIGRLAFRKPAIGQPLLTAATLLYAIPGLALLVLIPVVFSTPIRSRATMIIALTIYGIAVLVRSVADAFRSVDAELRTAAYAVGHSSRQIFWKVDFPLAFPIILAGIRVLCVSTISLVTIGALIGVKSLGTLLTDGFQRGIMAEVMAGIVATVLLALLIDALLLGFGRLVTPWIRAQRLSGASEKNTKVKVS